jgi:hypothetical protein
LSLVEFVVSNRIKRSNRIRGEELQMGGWSLGPQRDIPRYRPTPARLKAQWRSSEGENRQAIEVRRQWMTIMGCDETEIEEACVAFDLSLEDELEELVSAISLSK